MDLPGAVGVRPLRSGDIRVVLKDTSTKEHAINKGSMGTARVLRQDFPVEVLEVPCRSSRRVFKAAKESAPRLRYALLMETAKIQMERKRHEDGKPAPAATPPPRKDVGRPTDLAKAGAAAGRQALRWQHRASADTDRMEE